jgi:CheY-like chemotaxis protein
METSSTETRQAVLIVNDDGSIRKMVAEVLEQEGYRTSQAADGRGVLAILQASRERLIVLLDDRMPYRDGVAVLEAIAATEPALAHRHAFILVGSSFPPDSPVAQAARRLFPGVSMPFLPMQFTVPQLLSALTDAQSCLGGSS